MEIMEMVIEVIKNVGFPIAVVIYLFWQVEQERKAHKSESDQWVEALNKNTQVMTRLLDRLSAGDISNDN